MVDQIELATFTTPAATGDFDITDSALTETVKAAVIFFSSETDDDSDKNNAIAGCSFAADDGVATSEVTIGMSGSSINGLSTVPANVTRQLNSATDILISTHQRDVAANTTHLQCNYVGFIANGIRLNAATVTSFGGSPTRTKGSALMFAGVSRAYVGLAAVSAAGTLGSETVGGGTPFRPDLLILLSSDNGFADSYVNDARFSLGFVIDDGASSQVCAYFDWDNTNEPSDAEGEVSTNRGAVSINSSRTTQKATLTITDTGFNHQLTEGSGSPDIPYLAIKFTRKPAMAVGSVATPTSPDAAFEVLTPGVVPRAVMGMSSVLAASNTLTDGATAGACGYFAFTRTVQRAYTVCQEVGLTLHGDPGAVLSNTSTRQGDHAVLTYDHTGALAHQANLVGMGPGRFVLNFTSAATGFLTYLAIGYPGLTFPRRRRRARTARRAALRRRPVFIGGVPVGPLITPRWLKPVLRMRAQLRARLRWRPRPVLSVRVFGEPAEEAKGRIFSPGMIRGRIYGGGIPSPELEDPPPWPPFPPSWTTWTRDPTTATTALS